MLKVSGGKERNEGGEGSSKINEQFGKNGDDNDNVPWYGAQFT